MHILHASISNEVACQGILKYCLRDMLGSEQRESLFKLLDAISEVLSEIHDKTKLGEVEQRLNTALALLERDFPRCLQVHIYCVCFMHAYACIHVYMISLDMQLFSKGHYYSPDAPHCGWHKTFWTCLQYMDVRM